MCLYIYIFRVTLSVISMGENSCPRIVDTALNIWENNDIFYFNLLESFYFYQRIIISIIIYFYLIIFLFNWIRNFEEMKIFKLHQPFKAQEDTGVPFHRNFNSILRRYIQKNFLWASRLWVGRRKEPILGYVPKNDEKRIWSIKG